MPGKQNPFTVLIREGRRLAGLSTQELEEIIWGKMAIKGDRGKRKNAGGAVRMNWATSEIQILKPVAKK